MKELTDSEIHDVLATRRQIAVIWSVEDVQAVRPDLNEDQAWDVLQVVDRRHDATLGITWDTLEWAAQDLFGEAPDGDNESEGE